MGWARHGRYEYYYRVSRVNGRVVSKCMGRGEVAHAADRAVQERQAAEAKERATRQKWDQFTTSLRRYVDTSDSLVTAYLVAHGYYRHQRTWRRRMHVQGEPPRCDLDQADLDTIVQAANGGNQDALARLREILDEHPEIWQRVGDLGQHLENVLLNMIAGSNTILRESLERKIEDMKQNLVGPQPGLLADMVAHRIIVCWLEVQYADACHPEPTGSLAQGRFQLQRKESAQRRFQQALKTWKLTSEMAPKQLPGPQLKIVG